MKYAAIVAVTVAAAACGKGGGQSLSEGMKILCATDEEAGVGNVAPAERQRAKSKWIDARLKNPEVREVFATVGDLPPAERAQVVVTLLARSKLDRCEGLLGDASGGPVVNMRLPELAATAAGAVPFDDTVPLFTVVVSDKEILVEGRSVLALENGAVPASEREGGASGLMVPRVRELAKSLAAATPPGGQPLVGARLLLGPDATYQLLLQLMYSIKNAGLKRFDIVARRDGKVVILPIALPEMPTSVSADDLAKPPDLGIVVAVAKDKIIVFSLSGVEGTIQEPKLATAGVSAAELARVQQTLMEIHARHTDERRVVVMFDADTRMQLVAETIAVVRARPDGSPLFSDVIFSAGFQ